MKVPVTITVSSATVTKMFPKSFVLEDKNIHVDFVTNSNLIVSAIAVNKTKSFINVKSLTSYYKSAVFNQSNIDREIAPDSTTLQTNSGYDMFSNDMKNSSNFYKITKSKAQDIKINYGFAVKYHLNNTNEDKSIYETKKHSLYNIIKEYI